MSVGRRRVLQAIPKWIQTSRVFLTPFHSSSYFFCGDFGSFFCVKCRAPCAGFRRLLLVTILDAGDSAFLFVGSLLSTALVLHLVARCATSRCRSMLALRDWTFWPNEFGWSLRLLGSSAWCIGKVAGDVRFESCGSTCRVSWEFPVFLLKCLALCCCFGVRRRRTRSLGDCFEIPDETGLRTRPAFDLPFWSLRVVALPAALPRCSWFEVSYMDVISLLFVPWPVLPSASSSRGNVGERRRGNRAGADRSLRYEALTCDNDMNRESILRYTLKCIEKCGRIQLSRPFGMSKWRVRQEVTSSGECLVIVQYSSANTV